ncbi:MAG: TetR/AcrR family transcriptional regulator [Syntrophaceae bacterium]
MKEYKKKRFKPEIRRAQIVEATKELILERGLAWASVIRISKALGISQATLYYHFKSRREILLETLSSIVNESILKVLPVRPAENAEDFIRQAARSVYELTLADPRLSRLIFEFVCAPPTEDLREEIQLIFSSSIGMIEEAVRQGIREGLFKDDLDVTVVAWEIASLGIALNIGIMVEMPNFLSMEQALSAVERILQAIKR